MYLDLKEGNALKQVLGKQAGGHVYIDQCKIRGRRERIALVMFRELATTP